MCLIIGNKGGIFLSADTSSISPAQLHLSEAYAAQGKRGKGEDCNVHPPNYSYLIPTPITSAKSASPSHDVVQSVKASSNSVRSLYIREAKRQTPGEIAVMWSTTCKGSI